MAQSEFDSLMATKSGIVNATSEELYNLLDKRYLWWLNHTMGMRNQWRINSLFMQGFQWIALQPSLDKIVNKPMPRGRKKVTLNLLKPWAMDTEAKLMIDMPSFDVTPNTLAQKNKDAALAGEAYAFHLWKNLEMPQKYADIIRRCENFGHCFGHIDWDETIGPLFGQRVDDGEGNKSEELFTLGDMRYDILSPHVVITDELDTPTDQKPYIMFASWMSLDDIRMRWEEGVHVTGESRAHPVFDTMGLLYASNTTRNSIMYGESGEVPGAIVFHLLMRPQHSAPNGLIATFANGVELVRDEWPEVYSKMPGYPVVKYDWYKQPEVYRGESPLIDQIPVQVEINVLLSQLRENLDMVLALKWLNPLGSGVDDITDVAAQIIDYVPGFKPEILQPGSIPASAPRHLEHLLSLMEDVQMLHKASKGRNPAGSRSGLMLESLQEQDDRPLSVPENALHASLDKTFTKALQIASVAVDTERMVEYVGPNKRRQIIAFKGSDLRDNTNIHLQVVGGSSKSKVAVLRRILEFVQMGMYRTESGQVDTQRVMQMVRLAHPDVIYEEEDLHANLQRDENDILWQEGTPIPIPQSWEMHDTHLDEMDAEMNTLKWKEKAQSNPQWAARWIQHRQMHVQLRIGAMQPLGVAPQSEAQSGTGAA